MSIYLPFAFVFSLAFVAASILFPLAMRVSHHIGLIDKPNYRKLHQKPIPVIGGLVIMLSLVVTFLFSAGLQSFVQKETMIALSLLGLLATGVVDDRLSISSTLRFAVQIACAVAVASDGIRLHSLHGILGIHELPVTIQYVTTILIIVGVTNAFNLIDGINGLAGGMALLNVVVLSLLAIRVQQMRWLYFLLPLAAGLSCFLRYNWRSAKLFMGDGGSLVLGFAFAVTGLVLIRSSAASSAQSPTLFIVLVSGCCMFPVVDTMRVFYVRMRKGKSPFSADRNHLHHLFLRHRLSHAQTATRILCAHSMLLIFSAVAIQYLGLLWVIVGQIVFVTGYIWSLQIFTQFMRSYRYVKRLEISPA